jgi:hypothetical protein
VFHLGLGNQQPVKRIMMVKRESRQGVDMGQFDAKSAQIIGRLLAANYLLERHVQLEPLIWHCPLHGKSLTDAFPAR